MFKLNCIFCINVQSYVILLRLASFLVKFTFSENSFSVIVINDPKVGLVFYNQQFCTKFTKQKLPLNVPSSDKKKLKLILLMPPILHKFH